MQVPRTDNSPRCILTAPMHYKEILSFSTLHMDLFPVGEDLSVLLYGGDKPHVGCTVLTVPRPSLRGDGSVSCTSSVINLTGHKDEQICRYAAEALCKRYQAVVFYEGRKMEYDKTAIIMQWQMLLMLCFMVIYKQLSDAKTGTIIMLTVHGFLRKYLQI